MNVLQSLLEFYNSSSMDSTYRHAAGGILENLPHIPESNVHDIAEYAKSSRTTLWRMAKKLGYESFDDFLHTLKHAVRQYDYLNRFFTIERTDSIPELRTIAAKKTLNSLAAADRFFSDETLLQMTDLLHRANRIHFYLPCAVMGMYTLQQNLFMSGKKSVFACLPSDILTAVEELDENSIVFFCAEEKAECYDYADVLQKARGRNALIWLFGSSHSRYARYVDESFLDENDYTFFLALEYMFVLLAELYRIRYIDAGPQDGDSSCG